MIARTPTARAPSIPQIRNVQHRRARRAPPRAPHAPYPPHPHSLFLTSIANMHRAHAHLDLPRRAPRLDRRLPPLAVAPARALPRPARVQAVETVDGRGVRARVPA